MIFLLLIMGEVAGSVIIGGRCSEGMVVGWDGWGDSDSPLLSLPHNPYKLFPLSSSSSTSAQPMPPFLLTPSYNPTFLTLYHHLLLTNQQHQLTTQQTLPPRAIAHYSRHLCSSMQLPDIHLIIGGKSATGDGFELYEVVPGGGLFEVDYVIAGSGGNILAPIFDKYIRRDKDSRMSGEQLLDNTRAINWQTPSVNSGSYLLSTQSKKSKGLDMTLEELVATVKEALQSAARLDNRVGGEHMSILIMK
jgi:20S proteasome alpha/beta subunit